MLYKIIIKPLKNLTDKPVMEGKLFEEKGLRYKCLQHHIIRMDGLNSLLSIAAHDKLPADVLADFKKEGFIPNENWLLVMQCKIIPT